MTESIPLFGIPYGRFGKYEKEYNGKKKSVEP